MIEIHDMEGEIEKREQRQQQPKELKDDVNCEFPFQKDTDISAL